MRRIITIAARADAFCARLNDVLAAVAIALAALAVLLSVARAPEILRCLDVEWPATDGPY